MFHPHATTLSCQSPSDRTALEPDTAYHVSECLLFTERCSVSPLQSACYLGMLSTCTSRDKLQSFPGYTYRPETLSARYCISTSDCRPTQTCSVIVFFPSFLISAHCAGSNEDLAKAGGVNRHITWYTSPYPWSRSVCWIPGWWLASGH